MAMEISCLPDQFLMVRPFKVRRGCMLQCKEGPCDDSLGSSQGPSSSVLYISTMFLVLAGLRPGPAQDFPPKKVFKVSMGTGKTMVEFFSPAISPRVCR